MHNRFESAHVSKSIKRFFRSLDFSIVVFVNMSVTEVQKDPDLEKGAAVMRQEPPAVTVGLGQLSQITAVGSVGTLNSIIIIITMQRNV